MDQQPAPIPDSIQQPQIDRDREASKNKQKRIWGLICLFGPFALIILGSLMNLAASAIWGGVSLHPAGSTQMVAPQPEGIRVVDAISFTTGSIALATFFPGIIVGIVLLAKRKK